MDRDKLNIIIPNKEDVANFFENNKSIYFRYFEKRGYDVISNHLYTALYSYDGYIFGYGHVDIDGKKWLGIFIKEDFRGKNLSEYIVTDLLKNCTEDAYLSVDLENQIAFNLYKKMGFEVVEKNQKYHLMVHKKKRYMDSLGNVIDKLVTVDMKMWDNQEILYEIRKMSFEDFRQKYFDDIKGAEKLWEILKKATDLNVQRNQLINEVDEKIIQMFEAFKNGEDLDNGRFIQRSHKTY